MCYLWSSAPAHVTPLSPYQHLLALSCITRPPERDSETERVCECIQYVCVVEKGVHVWMPGEVMEGGSVRDRVGAEASRQTPSLARETL